jgi:hypothetical protein
MFAIPPLLLLAVAVLLVVAMPWHRPHPNHLFFLELLHNHLRDESELSGDCQASRDTSRLLKAADE